MGIISSNTIQIGRRLVKTFGEGENLKKVVTETLEDGNILTRVFNSEGKQLAERLKNVGNMEEVGDKLVKTTTKVIKDEEGVITKQVRDRVYDPALVKAQLDNMQKRNDLMKVVAEQYAARGLKVTESQLLNISRRPMLFTDESKSLYNLNKEILSTKTALGERVARYGESGNIFEKVLRIFQSQKSSKTFYNYNIRKLRNSSELDYAVTRLDGYPGGRDYNQAYNEKGLLLPGNRKHVFSINSINGKSLDNMKMEDMRRLWQKFYPGEKYSDVRSLARLDEPVEGDKITKLGKFL